MVNVTVEARNDVDTPGVVKLQGETWELNIWATTDELWKLADIEKTDWVQRRTLQVGTCARAPVWWNGLDGTVYIVVGNDDETWDAGVTVPLTTVHALLAERGEPPEVTPQPFGPTLFLARPSSRRADAWNTPSPRSSRRPFSRWYGVRGDWARPSFRGGR